MTEAPSLEALRARAHNISLFIIFMWATDLHDLSSDEGRELLRQHLQWQFDMEDRGILLGGGPLDSRYERPRTDGPRVDALGISIIAARSREEAERIAATEPLTTKGWRVSQIVSWTLNEGAGADVARQAVAAAERP